ncbi:MAG: flavin reductase family protein [Candidatus Brocadiia bacterium]|nr:flavin reductase family protein [Candidatus Brocadiia bacterium]
MKKSLGASATTFTNPAWVVGSYGLDGAPNMMLAALGGVCCLTPPCVYVGLRQATYTYGNIVQRRAYTVGMPSAAHVAEADYVGLASGRDVHKFAVTGLTPVRSDLVDAPYAAEFPLTLECELIHTIDLGLHTQFIGEVKDVKVDEAILDKNGGIDFARVAPFICSGGHYCKIGEPIGKTFGIGKNIENGPERGPQK